jgi:hypothetical protein
MVEINKENKYYIELLGIKEKFSQFPNYLFNDIVTSLLREERILNNQGQIDLELFEVSKKSPSFIEKNKKRLEEDKYLKKEYTDFFLKKIKQYGELESSGELVVARGTEEPYAAGYSIDRYNSEVPEGYAYSSSKEINPNKVIPKEDYTMASFINNMKLNINTEHLFNALLVQQHHIKNTSFVQRAKIRIIGYIEKTEFPITYKAYCANPFCDNNIEYTALDMSTNLHCDFGHAILDANMRHSISTNRGIVNKTVNIYGYSVEIEKEDGRYEELDEIFWFLEEQDNAIIDCEFLRYAQQSGGTMKNRMFIVISKNRNFENKRLQREIICTSKSRDFLEDIYQSLKRYLKEEHEIMLRDDNKIISLFMIFQCCAMLLGKKFYFMVLGKTGSGKTFLSNIFPPLFTGMFVEVNGAQATKNRVIGGTGVKSSPFSSNVFQKGVVGTHDYVVFEEISNSFDTFGGDKTNNVFSMLKLTYNGRVPITSQGTRTYETTASLFLNGNIEQLNTVKEYIKKLKKKYRKNDFDNRWPLFMPIDYYKKKLKNPDLAKSHYEVRYLDEENINRHYVTGLPQAEMNRYPLFVIIEGEEEEELTDFYQKNEKLKSVIHREQIVEEIGMKIKKEDFASEEAEKFFEEKVYPYLKDEFLQKRQNFRPQKTNINNHMKKNLFLIAKIFFFCQKKFYGEPLDITNYDKKLFECFMSYNNNVLSTKQARMEERPFINDYSGFSIKSIMEEEAVKEIAEEEHPKEYFKDEKEKDIFTEYDSMEEFG